MSTLQRTAAPQVAPDPEATAGREGGPARAEHTRRRTRLAEQYAATPAGGPVRLAKRTSNLFRARRASAERLDVRGLDHVLAIDPVARTADVQGITTYEHLVDATLAHGLMPLVVPQLKTITVGGAVSGLGIESSSFRSGLPHESVIEMATPCASPSSWSPCDLRAPAPPAVRRPGGVLRHDGRGLRAGGLTTATGPTSSTARPSAPASCT